MQVTMKALYQARTGDTTSHQRAIDARFKKLDTRRQAIVRAVLAGDSYRMIGEKHGITAGSVQSALNSAMERIRKDIAAEPRYNHTGRGPHKKGPEA
jgi:DNA-directed RNA polymerase specialized sigma24 family protein